MSKAFISYSSADRAFARRLWDRLTSMGIVAWLDEKKLQVGDSIIKEIGEAISDSDFVIAVLSKTSVRSVWVQKELSLAMTEEQNRATKVVLPVKIDDCDIPAFLKDKFYVDFSEEVKFENALYQLLAVIPTDEDVCSYCGYTIPLTLGHCPHCGRQTSPPNVRAARSKDEQDALHARYLAAVDLASSAGCHELVKQFESAVRGSKAVLQRSIQEIERLAAGEGVHFSSYYRLLDKGTALIDKWNRTRRFADEALFPGHADSIAFGTLSLNNFGLSKYGECTLVLREDLIGHRASVFEGNSAAFAPRHNYKIPVGYRSTWQDRHKLCVAKLAETLVRLQPVADNFAEVLLAEAVRAEDDEFIEVHIWGPISVRAVERVVVHVQQDTDKWTRVLRDRLSEYGTEVDLVQARREAYNPAAPADQ